MSDDDTPVLLQIESDVAKITLNRPQRLNAFTSHMHTALRAALDKVEAHKSIGALVVSGSGRGFCAGQDLAERAEQLAHGEVDLGKSLRDNYNPLIRRMAELPFPVIAAVNGIAAGAGASLAIACDIIIAATSARFQFSFAKVGLGPDSGTSWFLPRLVGLSRARALSMTADVIDAKTAKEIGLVWEIAEDAELAVAAQRLARQFAAGPRAALTSIKSQFRQSPNVDLKSALDCEQTAQEKLGAHPDYREAITAFMEKRPPKFQPKGRT